MSLPRPPAARCLDANDVAALVAGTLADDEREALVAHAAVCGACRAWIAAADVAPTEAIPAPPPRAVGRPAWRAWAPFAAAAALLAAFVVGGRVGAPTPSLAEVAARCEVALVDGAALAARPRGPARGGLAVLAPRGVVGDGRPEVRFTAVPGAVESRATVRDAEGRLRLDVASPRGAPVATVVPWPDGRAPLDAGGTYVVKVVVRTPAGEASGSEAFRVASAAEAAVLAAAVERVRRRAPPSLRGLLCAHLAVAAQRWDEADRWLARAVEEGAPRAAVAPLRARVDHERGATAP